MRKQGKAVSDHDGPGAPGPRHVPVLVGEVLDLLAPGPGHVIVDGTCGAGGHAQALARCVQPGGRVIAMDLDPRMLELARRGAAGLPITFCEAPFDELRERLDEWKIAKVDAVLADLGFCSDQLADPDKIKPGQVLKLPA